VSNPLAAGITQSPVAHPKSLAMPLAEMTNCSEPAISRGKDGVVAMNSSCATVAYIAGTHEVPTSSMTPLPPPSFDPDRPGDSSTWGHGQKTFISTLELRDFHIYMPTIHFAHLFWKNNVSPY